MLAKHVQGEEAEATLSPLFGQRSMDSSIPRWQIPETELSCVFRYDLDGSRSPTAYARSPAEKLY